MNIDCVQMSLNLSITKQEESVLLVAQSVDHLSLNQDPVGAMELLQETAQLQLKSVSILRTWSDVKQWKNLIWKMKCDTHNFCTG